LLHTWLLSNLTQVTMNTRKKVSAGVRFEPTNFNKHLR